MNLMANRVDTSYPPLQRAAYVIGVLWLVTLFSQLDRQLPALLVRPIRAEFAISDTQFSLLQGYAFAIFYTVMGLPFGRMVDRYNRQRLIIFGIALWSGMTVLAGFAQSYGQLLMTRMGVGIGEAVLAPAAYSIIADYVAPARRGRALGIYYVSLAIGSGASLLLGGLIFRWVPEQGIVLPMLGHLAPWQLMFVLAGAPGLLLILLTLTVREPQRHELAGGADSSIADVLRFLRIHAATFARLLTYPAVLAIIGYGVLAWAPAFFERTHGMPPSQSGPMLGVLVAVAGLTGTLCSGFLSDPWTAAGHPAARFRVTLIAWALIIPCAIAWPLMPTAALALAVLAAAIFGISLGQAAAPPSIQEVVPNHMRGQVIAIYLLLGGLLGIGLGPTAVALATDYLYADDQALGLALITVSAPAALLGLWLSWSGQRPYARTRAALR